MNESGQVYNYNKLRTIRTLTDIISQCIVAFAFSAFVILGLTNKSDSYIIATLLMAVPVIITYAARKNIHKNVDDRCCELNCVRGIQSTICQLLPPLVRKRSVLSLSQNNAHHVLGGTVEISIS